MHSIADKVATKQITVTKKFICFKEMVKILFRNMLNSTIISDMMILAKGYEQLVSFVFSSKIFIDNASLCAYVFRTGAGAPKAPSDEGAVSAAD